MQFAFINSLCEEKNRKRDTIFVCKNFAVTQQFLSTTIPPTHIKVLNIAHAKCSFLYTYIHLGGYIRRQINLHCNVDINISEPHSDFIIIIISGKYCCDCSVDENGECNPSSMYTFRWWLVVADGQGNPIYANGKTF